MQNLVMSANITLSNNYPRQDIWVFGVKEEESLFANHLSVYLMAIFVYEYL